MVASMRARVALVLTTTVFAFLGMAAMAALTTIVRDMAVHPQPVVTDLAARFSEVRINRHMTVIPKLSFASYREQYAAQKKQWAAEDAAAEALGKQKQAEMDENGFLLPEDYDEVANDFGHRGGPGFVAKANNFLTRLLVALVDRLAALPVVGPRFEGRRQAAHRKYTHPFALHADDKLGYPITRSPYVDPATDTIEEGCYEIPPERSVNRERVSHYYPQLLPFEREHDIMSIMLTGTIDLKPLWDWNTKAIYVSFLARYQTRKATLNEVVFLDVIVRDVALPWKLRHLKDIPADSRTPWDAAAMESFLESVRHPVHDAAGARIDHVAKTVTLTDAAKYPMADLYANTLAGTEVEIVVRYQVMSYSGWAPVLELPPVKTGPLVLVPTQEQQQQQQQQVAPDE